MSSLPQVTGDGWPPETAPQPAPGLSGRTVQGLRGDPRGLWRSGREGLKGQPMPSSPSTVVNQGPQGIHQLVRGHRPSAVVARTRAGSQAPPGPIRVHIKL